MIDQRTKRHAIYFGFTLIEVMISLALVLILILGVNYIFKTTSDAIGAGQMTNSFSRNSQSVQTTLFNDLNSTVKNPPCFIVASQIVPQFLNAGDASTGSDPTVIYTANSSTTTAVNYAGPSYRVHYCDLLRYFAHGFYRRQTANSNAFSSTTTGDDAFVTVGMAQLPNTNGNGFSGPTSGSTSEQQNIGAYASDWVLARSVVLLKPVQAMVYSPTQQYNSSSNSFYENNYPPTAAAPSPYVSNVAPLAYDATDNTNTWTTQSSRYDLATVTMEQFRRYLADEILQWQNAGYTGTHLWWNSLIYDQLFTQSAQTLYWIPSGNTGAAYYSPGLPPNSEYAFVSSTNAATPTPAYTVSPTPTPNLVRAECNPLISTPLSPTAAAQMAPYLLQHCSQFIVEYAGDYIQQITSGAQTGAMSGIGPDGQIDYYYASGGERYIRWYGMPRSSHHDFTSNGTPLSLIRGYCQTTDDTSATNNPTQISQMSQFRDVIPLRDFYTMWFNWLNSDKKIYAPPFEVDDNIPLASKSAISGEGDYGLAGTLSSTSRYACAWYNDMPWMIRILIKVDDPNNKLQDGPWYEFIYKLK